MAFLEGANAGLSNSTTDVIVVDSPGASETRIVKSITVYNNDTVAAEVTLKYFDGTNERKFCVINMEPGDNLVYDSVLVLDGEDDTIELVLGGAITTNQLHFTAHYGTAS